MKISASIYSNKEKSLEHLVHELDAHGIDMFHIDCFDDRVFEDIAKIRRISKTPVDLHIINNQPGQFFDKIKENHIEYVSIQYGKDVVIPELPSHPGTLWGLALTSNDDTGIFKQSKQDFDFVLFMASEPGVSGLPFNKSTFQRIINFKQMFPKKQVQADGGINDRIAFILRLLGVNSIVSGNYLLNREHLGAGMLNLHKTPYKNNGPDDFNISDFMTPPEYLPVIDKSELTLQNALETIEKYGMGFVLITGNGNKLEGVISNADMRRGFIRYIKNPEAAEVAEMINTKPVMIGDKDTLAGMLHLLNNLNFIILFLPVVDVENNLKGTVLLNNLTRV